MNGVTGWTTTSPMIVTLLSKTAYIMSSQNHWPILSSVVTSFMDDMYHLFRNLFKRYQSCRPFDNNNHKMKKNHFSVRKFFHTEKLYVCVCVCVYLFMRVCMCLNVRVCECICVSSIYILLFKFSGFFVWSRKNVESIRKSTKSCEKVTRAKIFAHLNANSFLLFLFHQLNLKIWVRIYKTSYANS